jgi:hypothetical protein
VRWKVREREWRKERKKERFWEEGRRAEGGWFRSSVEVLY